MPLQTIFPDPPRIMDNGTAVLVSLSISVAGQTTVRELVAWLTDNARPDDTLDLSCDHYRGGYDDFPHMTLDLYKKRKT